jgi:hypothetical protein
MYPNHRFYTSYCGVDLINILALVQTPSYPTNSLSHILKYHSFIFNPMSYLPYHRIIRNLKCWINHFQLHVLFDYVAIGMVCLCWVIFVIVCTESYVSCWEKWKIVFFKKASDTHSSTYFHYYISIFSSMHDRLFFKEVYAILDPSSV